MTESELRTVFLAARQDASALRKLASRFQRDGRAASAHYLWWRAHRLAPQDVDGCIELGRAELAIGAVVPARTCFATALTQSPDHAIAHAGTAACLLFAGEADAATAHIAGALDGAPPPAICHELAQLAMRAGASELAARAFDRLAHTAADDPSWWLARARCERECGDPTSALAWVDRYGRQFPQDAAARLEKARCLHALGQDEQARRWLEQLESRQPGLAENSEIYGQTLNEPTQAELRARHWVRAIELWTAGGNATAARLLAQRLLREQPTLAAGWNALARLELAQSSWDAAEQAWRQALLLDPTLLDAAAGLANLHEECNRGDAAEQTAVAGLAQLHHGEVRSGAIELHLVRARTARRRKDATAGLEHLQRAEALARSDAQHEHIAFERGRLRELQHDDEGAFTAFARGNELALSAWQQRYPGANAYLAGVEAMHAHVAGGGLQRWAPITDAASVAPTFLVGFPRSGTSLLNQVLDGHRQIQAMEEKPPAQRLLAAVRAMPHSYPDALAHLDAIDIDYLRQIYFRSAAEHGGGDRSRLLLDKFPLHINLAALLHRVFPTARFVFALRHPCDVVLSCFMQQFRLNHAMANFCTLEGTVALYARTMDLWQLVCEHLPIPVHRLRYEDVVTDFDGQMRALCEFLGVAWLPDLRNFAERAHARGRIDTPSYAQVSRPLYADAMYRWQRYRRQLAPWLPVLQPYIERFGYA